MKTTSYKLAALTAAALLSACGGGSSSDSPSLGAPDTPPPAPPVVVQSSTIVTDVQTSNYLAGTQAEETAAFNLINAERAHCGFGTLAQNTKLDASAKSHADWQLANHYVGHYQVAGTPGFTGVSPRDRVAFFGYALGDASEVFTSGLGSNVQGFGTASVRGLLNAPYHLAAFMESWREVGVSVRNSIDVPSAPAARKISIFNLGYAGVAGPQQFAADEVKTYPCEGSAGVDSSMDGEVPNPVPGRNLNSYPLGTSVLVMLRRGQRLQTASASITKVSTNTAVTVRPPVGSDNDPNKLLLSHQAYVAADAPLEPMTQYQVNITGSNNGVAFKDISYRFTTGN